METTEQRLPLTTAVSQLRLDTRASATDYKIAASAPQCRRSQSRAHLPRDGDCSPINEQAQGPTTNIVAQSPEQSRINRRTLT